VVSWLPCQHRRCRASLTPSRPKGRGFRLLVSTTGNVSAGRQFLMPGQISSAVDMKKKILEILRQEGAAPVYKLVKSLGLTYGAV